MDNPSKITEGVMEYSIGEFDGNSVLYDFDKILIYLNAKGKLLFGREFRIYDEDLVIIRKLCYYFIKDKENCQKDDIDLNKGILLSGPVGCGKTTLMKLLRHIVPQQRPYEMIPWVRYTNILYKVIETSFTLFKLHLEPTFRCYALERTYDYGTKN